MRNAIITKRGETMEYEIIKSNRKTISICIKNDGSILVKAPKFVSIKYISDFVTKNSTWIVKIRKKVIERQSRKVSLNSEQIKFLKEKAVSVINEKVKFYAMKIGVVPNKVTIGSAKSYWGYCDKNNNLNFSYRLMLASESTIDYVVAHELIHIHHHNHSKAFWTEVQKIIPNYKENKKELKSLTENYN